MNRDTATVGRVLAFFGLYLVALSLFMLIAPGAFFDEIAPIGERNDHYIRDGATFQLALGVLALFAAKRPGLRLAATVVIGLQFFLHALNHLLDMDQADPRWLGTADFVALAVGVLVLAWLYWRIRREAR